MIIRLYKDGSAALIDETSPDKPEIKVVDGGDNPYTEVPATEENIKKYFKS